MYKLSKIIGGAFYVEKVDFVSAAFLPCSRVKSTLHPDARTRHPAAWTILKGELEWLKSKT